MITIAKPTTTITHSFQSLMNDDSKKSATTSLSNYFEEELSDGLTSKISDDVFVYKIFSFLYGYEIIRDCSTVCKRWYRLSHFSQLWNLKLKEREMIPILTHTSQNNIMDNFYDNVFGYNTINFQHLYKLNYFWDWSTVLYKATGKYKSQHIQTIRKQFPSTILYYEKGEDEYEDYWESACSVGISTNKPNAIYRWKVTLLSEGKHHKQLYEEDYLSNEVNNRDRDDDEETFNWGNVIVGVLVISNNNNNNYPHSKEKEQQKQQMVLSSSCFNPLIGYGLCCGNGHLVNNDNVKNYISDNSDNNNNNKLFPLEVNQSISLELNLKERTISYFLNDKPLGIAFDNIPLTTRHFDHNLNGCNNKNSTSNILENSNNKKNVKDVNNGNNNNLYYVPSISMKGKGTCISICCEEIM
ncbi:hypothetical protein ABK040_004227 [Willaertia magna]